MRIAARSPPRASSTFCRPRSTPGQPAGWTWEDFRRAAEAVVADTDLDGRKDVFGFDFPRNLYQ